MSPDEYDDASTKREIKSWFKRLLRLILPAPLTPKKFVDMLKSADSGCIFKKNTMAMMERIALLSEIPLQMLWWIASIW